MIIFNMTLQNDYFTFKMFLHENAFSPPKMHVRDHFLKVSDILQQQHCVFEFQAKPSTLIFWSKKRFSSLTKRICCFARKNRFLRLIFVGRRKFKFLETKFVFEAKMMKKLPKKSLCFSHHRWYFFFTPPLIFFFHSIVDIFFSLHR